MNKQPSLLYRIFRRPPVIFPLLSLFLIGLTLFEAWNWLGDTSLPKVYWWRPVILLGYTVFWIGANFLKKWAAVAFIVLTIANISLQFFGADGLLRTALGDILFPQVPLHLFLCILLLFYFRQMD